MSESILIDTDILIDLASKIPIAVSRLNLEARSSSLSISVVTQMELIVGCRNKIELQNLDKFLQHYEVISINESISEKAVELVTDFRLSHGLLIPDALIAATLIAATAITLNTHLLSKNQKDYRFIPGLDLLAYP